MNIRLIDTPLALPKYRQIRLPTVATEFSPYAEVSINDENIEPVDFSYADLVGITAQAYNFPRAIYLADRFKKLGIPTILGGPASFMTRQALEHFDAVVVGEVEGLGEKIIQDLEKGNLKGVYRLDVPPKNWGQRLPRRDLQKAGEYYWINFPIEFTRGCPHKCAFCFGRYAHPGFRTRSIDSIGYELDQWDHGLVEAVDLHFAADSEYIIEVCKLLEQRNVLGWYGEATLRSLDNDRLLAHLESSNCKAVFVGMESVEKHALDMANKGFNRIEDFSRIIQKAQDHGVFIHAGLMWGLDGQSPEAFETTAKFCEQAGVYIASTNIATWFPGTQAYNDLERQDRLLTDDFRKYDGLHVIASVGAMPEAQVYDGARRFLKRFYSLKSIFFRSFQAPNCNFAQLVDFWALNLTYRVYYKMWARRLGKNQTPWQAPKHEKHTFPHMGGKMPLIYSIGNWEWKVFYKWYTAWEKKWDDLSLYAAIWPVLAWAVVGVLGFLQMEIFTANHWPIKYPPVIPVMCVYVVAAWVSAWLISRIARAGPPRSRSFSWILTVLTTLSVLPFVLLSLCLHPIDNQWAFFLCLFTCIFFLKSLSVVLSVSEKRKKALHVIYFLLFFPTLDFDACFSIDNTKKHLIRHLPLGFIGFGKLVVSAVLLPFLILLVYLTGGKWQWEPVLTFLRLAYLYLVLCGTLEWFTAYWRMAGYIVPDPFGPGALGPYGPRKLWNAWNRPLRDFLVKHVYIPLGGSNRPIIATMAVFLLTGLLTAFVVFISTRHLSFGIILFFMVNGLLVLVEKLAFPKGASPIWEKLLYVLAIAVFFLTAPWLFHATDRLFW